MKASLPLILVLSLFAAPALAQEPTALEGFPSEISANANSTVNLSSEGLDDADLSVDLAAEALPTTNRFSYRWELLRDNLISVFTFNAEKKTILYQQRLHSLDRKLAACSEIGDTDCVDKIEEHMQCLESRAERYFANKKAITAKFQARFETWRENRESLIQARREKAQQLHSRRQELRQQRQSDYKAARQRRQERRQQIRDRRQQRRGQRQDRIQELRDQRQLNIEQRQQNREELIQMRSDTLKQELDNTRAEVQIHDNN